ncbi:hypothetical protein CN415_14950 [Bacillus cereus]|nr:hypothetical protein CN415_14950 [Bacillus cereus]
MSNFKYYHRNLKLHEVEFEILLVVFEIRVKIKKGDSLEESPFNNHIIIQANQVRTLQSIQQSQLGIPL